METAHEQSDRLESERISALARQLGEDFDAVVILATRHEGSRGTRTISKGSGNWHAQYGLVSEWLLNRDEDICKAVWKEPDDA